MALIRWVLLFRSCPFFFIVGFALSCDTDDVMLPRLRRLFVVWHVCGLCVSSGLLAVATTASFTDSDDGTTFDGCGVRDSTAYYYPNEDTTQYLYETFPEVRWPTTRHCEGQCPGRHRCSRCTNERLGN